MNPLSTPTIGKDEILTVLASGCDERLHVCPDTGLNKYHLNPVEFETLFQRGSCTANVLTPSSYTIAQKFLQTYDALNYESLLERQASRLLDLVRSMHRDPFDVFFAPSGTDLVYYPLMFQWMLNPNKRIVNIVSCPEELGSGSMYASKGRFYANFNQFGDRVEKGELVDPERTCEVYSLDARDPSGKILNRSQAIQDIILSHQDASVIGSLVFGSKSGIKDNLDLINPKDNVMWVVDLCQFRVDRGLVHELVEKEALIMLTGSKFFQAPPFCAAMLVPRAWSERLQDVDASVIAPYGQLFSAYDVPWFMRNMRNHLPARENKALRLRMEIALDEMESYSQWSMRQTDDIIDRWAAGVMSRLEQSPHFTLMPDQLKTNMSIVSFQVWANGRSLNHAELKELFKAVCTTTHDGLQDGYDRVFFGQPVQYGDKSFLRFAIGAHSVRHFLENGPLNLANDYRLIELIEKYTVEHFGTP